VRNKIRQISGNLSGIKPAQLRALERTFRRKVDPDRVITPELAQHLCGISNQLRRQVGVLLTRDGVIRDVIVGDAHRLEIPEIGRLRGGSGRLRGLRLVHTHLNSSELDMDDLNDLVLLRLDLVAAVKVESSGLPGGIQAAHVLPLREGRGRSNSPPYQIYTGPDVRRLELDFLATIRSLESEFGLIAAGSAKDTGIERALVIGIGPDEDGFAETLELAASAEVFVAGTVRQRRNTPHPKSVVGSGKLSEIALEGMRRQADVAIFDVDLKPAQARAFENATGMKAIDRTQLILDIFAQRAQSRDGKIQVELARLKYSLPRLVEKDAGLSRLTGGIGVRGPGETVMELGRRRIFDRIRKLEKEVGRLSARRDLRRSRRRRNQLPVLSIIGYTNAGKTTLLNALTCSKVASADKLFVTLDPTTRRLKFPRRGEVVLTDTVGFIRDLPPDLVAAFKATLEELASADLLLHVADAADERLELKLEAVGKILADLDLRKLPLLMVLNKCDLIDSEKQKTLCRRYDAVGISAERRTGLDELIEAVEKRLRPTRPVFSDSPGFSRPDKEDRMGSR